MTNVCLQADICVTPWFIELMADDEFCAELWTAFANVDWYRQFDPLSSPEQQVLDKLKNDIEAGRWGRSFRGMGATISDIRNEFFGKTEDYMTWYCSNMRFSDDGDTFDPRCRYGYVSQRVREALNRMGWYPVKDSEYFRANDV